MWAWSCARASDSAFAISRLSRGTCEGARRPARQIALRTWFSTTSSWIARFHAGVGFGSMSLRVVERVIAVRVYGHRKNSK